MPPRHAAIDAAAAADAFAIGRFRARCRYAPLSCFTLMPYIIVTARCHACCFAAISAERHTDIRARLRLWRHAVLVMALRAHARFSLTSSDVTRRCQSHVDGQMHRVRSPARFMAP